MPLENSLLTVPVTPGITALEYAQRRTRLAAKLPRGSVAILAAADIKYRSGAVFYDFHQESNFFYLTGFNEPEALAIIGPSADGKDHVFRLYLRPKDREAEQWEGGRSGIEGARDVFNADEAGDINQLASLMKPIIRGASEIFTDIPTRPPGSILQRFLSSNTSTPEGFTKLVETSNVKPLRPILNDLRAFKSDAEIANMRKVGQMSGRAITQAMRQKWTREKDLGAFLEYEFQKQGCDSSAYVPVIAGGKHALTVHYTRNDAMISSEEMVLVDAGGEYGNYITDITRTFPSSGRYSPAQRDLYSAVLEVQRRCISLCRQSSGLSLDKLHELAEDGLKANLGALGFDMSSKALRTLFPHHLGHYVGLDVHDTPGLSRQTPLSTGQCVTIEPGIYVPDDSRWPSAFRGMGVRIEDSVAVQDESPLVLTTEAVKEVEDIEALRS